MTTDYTCYGTSELIERIHELEAKQLTSNEPHYSDDHKQPNYVDMADVCELAHELTRLECKGLGIDVDYVDFEVDETGYTEQTQPIFDKYYELITNTLNV